VWSYQYDGYWTDIGNIDSFFEANIGLTDDIPKFNLFDSNIIYSRSRKLPPSKFAGCLLDKVIVAGGCIINAEKIERSVIGVRSRIGKGTVLKNTYMMGADHYQTIDEIQHDESLGKPLLGVGESCHIDYAIIDKGACIGNNVQIVGGKHLKDGDFSTHTIKDGIVVIKKQAIIESNTVIGGI